MKYIDQQMKKEITPRIREVLEKYNMRANIFVRDNETLVVNIRSGALDLIGNAKQVVSLENKTQAKELRHKAPKKYININPYWYHRHFDGHTKKFLDELFDSIKGEDPWFDNMEDVDLYDTPYQFRVVAGEPKRPYRYVK